MSVEETEISSTKRKKKAKKKLKEIDANVKHDDTKCDETTICNEGAGTSVTESKKVKKLKKKKRSSTTNCEAGPGVEAVSFNTAKDGETDVESSDAKKKAKKKKRKTQSITDLIDQGAIAATSNGATSDTTEKKPKKKKKGQMFAGTEDNESIRENADDKINCETGSNDTAEKKPKKKRKTDACNDVTNTENLEDEINCNTGSCDTTEKQTKKRKKKNQCPDTNVTEDVDNKVGYDTGTKDATIEKKPKKKKRKVNECVTEENSIEENTEKKIDCDAGSCDTAEGEPKKKKKGKRNACTDMPNNESSLEQTDGNIDCDPVSCDTSEKKLKRKKKRKTHEGIESTNSESIVLPQETDSKIESGTASCDVAEKKPKKKKKGKVPKGTEISISNNESTENMEDKTDCNTEPCDIQRKKSKKRKKVQPEASAPSNGVDDSDMVNTTCDPDTRNKRKKKKKEKLCEVTVNHKPPSNNKLEECGTSMNPKDVEDDTHSTHEQPKRKKKRKSDTQKTQGNDSAHMDDGDLSQSTAPIKTETKKRKSINGHGGAEAPSDSVTTAQDQLGQWSTAQLSTEKQQKFARLLGGMKNVEPSMQATSNGGSILSRLSGVSKPANKIKLWGNTAQKRTFSSMALNATQSENLAAKLEGQFNNTLAFNLQKKKEGNKAKGLGFQEDPAKGKKHHIDVEKRRSIVLE